MATAVLKPSTPMESALVTIRKQVIEAVKVMFDRAVEHGAETPDVSDTITDRKTSSRASVQDCEFGMTLLLVRGWIGDEFFAAVDSSKFETVIVALAKRTIERVLVRMEVDEGGDGNHAVFFTGEPYSKYKKGGLDRYSANLDAAMINLAFLALGLEQFNEKLGEIKHGIQEANLPGWVKSLRDAALFVILEGLQYACECRVLYNGQFQGFTCDPDSNTASPADGSLKNNEDRLFFTWTACETINDMIDWRKSYIEGKLSMLPVEAVTRLRSLIDDLEGTLRQAAEWCHDRFFPELEKFEPEDPKELVRQIGQLAGKKMGPKQKEGLDQVEKNIQHVYHMSQYAAVRSLAPERVLLQEVRTIMDKVDQLVTRSIIASKLDEAEQPDLFRTLTRKYSLGKSNPESYQDDAWYPLVVRSLSGLLSRTLSEIGKRFSRSEVLSLTLTFQRSLETHVKNLIDRRPQGGKDGPDGKLWSFAGDQPYVLYATQRTIFALMKYEEFLIAAEAFVKDVPDAGKREEELSMLVARKLSDDYFRPVIRELLSQVPASSPFVAVALSNGQPSHDLPLPEESWAARVLRDWLTRFTDDFKKSQVAAMLRQRAQSLKLIKKYAENYQPSENLPQRKKDNARGQLQELKGQYERICKFGSVGQKLSQLAVWEDEDLIAILFEHVLQEYIQRSIGDFLRSDSIELWKLIHDAKDRQDNISNIDGAATVL